MQKFLYQSFPQSSEVTYEMNSKIFQDSNSSSEKDPHPLTKQVTSGIINHCKIHSMTSQSRNSRNSGRTEKGEEEEAYSKALYTSYQKQRCVPALLKRKGWGGGSVTGRSSDASLTGKKPIFSTELHISLENPHSVFHSQLKGNKYVTTKSVLFIQPIKKNPYK